MISIASAGTADRIAARICFNALRAGAGTLARYSSKFFGVPFRFAAEVGLPDFTFHSVNANASTLFAPRGLIAKANTYLELPSAPEFSFAYSDFAATRIGILGSASFHNAKKSWYAARAFAESPAMA